VNISLHEVLTIAWPVSAMEPGGLKHRLRFELWHTMITPMPTPGAVVERGRASNPVAGRWYRSTSWCSGTLNMS